MNAMEFSLQRHSLLECLQTANLDLFTDLSVRGGGSACLVPTHRFALATVSPLMTTVLSDVTSAADDAIVIIPDVDRQTIKRFLQLIHCQPVPYNNDLVSVSVENSVVELMRMLGVDIKMHTGEKPLDGRIMRTYGGVKSITRRGNHTGEKSLEASFKDTSEVIKSSANHRNHTGEGHVDECAEQFSTSSANLEKQLVYKSISCDELKHSTNVIHPKPENTALHGGGQHIRCSANVLHIDKREIDNSPATIHENSKMIDQQNERSLHSQTLDNQHLVTVRYSSAVDVFGLTRWSSPSAKKSVSKSKSMTTSQGAPSDTPCRYFPVGDGELDTFGAQSPLEFGQLNFSSAVVPPRLSALQMAATRTPDFRQRLTVLMSSASAAVPERARLGDDTFLGDRVDDSHIDRHTDDRRIDRRTHDRHVDGHTDDCRIDRHTDDRSCGSQVSCELTEEKPCQTDLTVSTDVSTEIQMSEERRRMSGMFSAKCYNRKHKRPDITTDLEHVGKDWGRMQSLIKDEVSAENDDKLFEKPKFKKVVMSSRKRLAQPCQDCGKCFSSAAFLKRHVCRTVNKIDCPSCSYCTNSWSDLRKHTRREHQRIFRCGVCQKAFRHPDKLQKHTQNTHLQGFSCDICPSSFKTIIGLNAHSQTHKREKPHSCDRCGKPFSNFANLRKHLRLHCKDVTLADSIVKCKACHKTFADSELLKVHLSQSITSEQSTDDPKLSTGPQHLQVLSEHNVESSNAAECGSIKALSQHNVESSNTDCGSVKSPFEQNVESSNAECGSVKAYACNNCHLSFATEDHLSRHSIAKHKNAAGPIKCCTCSYTTSKEWYLRQHFSRMHSRVAAPCKVCGKTFNSKENLYRHNAAMHPAVPTSHCCDTCGFTCRAKNDLRRHIKAHTGEKPYGCVKCGATFTTAAAYGVHMRLHMGRRPNIRPPRLVGTTSRTWSRSLRTAGLSRSHQSSAPDMAENRSPSPNTLAHEQYKDELMKRCLENSNERASEVHKGENPSHESIIVSTFEETGKSVAGINASGPASGGPTISVTPVTVSATPGAVSATPVGVSATSVILSTTPVAGSTTPVTVSATPVAVSATPVAVSASSFPCRYCSYCFTTVVGLYRHVRCRHLGGRFKCDRCTFSTRLKSALVNHIARVHDKIKNFACDVCAKRFASRADVELHKKFVHLNVRNFICERCSKGFVTANDLTKHIRTHSDEKLYQCGKCGSRFKDASTSYRHMRDVCKVRPSTSSSSPKVTPGKVKQLSV